MLGFGCFIDDSKHVTLYGNGRGMLVTMPMFADICLSLSLLVYLAGLIVLVPEPVSRHTCAQASLRVASVLIVASIWILVTLAMATALATSSHRLEWMGLHPYLISVLLPLILIPLAIVTSASGMFMHIEPEDVPSCFRMWSAWAIIVIPALLISLAGTMLHGSSNMRTLMGMLSGAISILASASILCALRFALLRRTARGRTSVAPPQHHPQPTLATPTHAHTHFHAHGKTASETQHSLQEPPHKRPSSVG